MYGTPTRSTPNSGSRAARWQDDGLSVSFRACQLQGLASLHEALAQAAQSDQKPVVPADVMHLDLAENEVEQTAGLQPFTQLLSLDLSRNNVEALDALPGSLLHLNAAYNRVESVESLAALSRLVELNLSYNLLTSLQPLEQCVHLQVLLVAGNRIGSLQGLASLALLECLDLKCNYVERLPEVRLLSLNAALRVLTLQGNPVAKVAASYRAAIVSGERPHPGPPAGPSSPLRPRIRPVLPPSFHPCHPNRTSTHACSPPAAQSCRRC